MFKTRLFLFLLCISLVLLALAGCQSGVKRGSDDPTLDDKALSRKLDLKDVDQALGELMEEFKKSGFVQSIQREGGRPGIAVDMIVNETDQHGINTSRLLQSFETQIVNIGLFAVVSQENLARFKQTLTEQNSDWYNGATVPNAGNLYGFRYLIGGKLFGETERLSGKARTQYRLVLRAMDVESGIIEWQGNSDVTKFQN